MRVQHVIRAARMAVVFAAGALALMAATPASAQGVVHNTPHIEDIRLSGWCQTIMTTNASFSSPGEFWVRNGGRLSVTGVRQTVIVASGGIAEVDANGSWIYVMKGGRAVIKGARNRIVAEPGADVVMIGGSGLLSTVSGFEVHHHRNSGSCGW
jgi:hypothetical protein